MQEIPGHEHGSVVVFQRERLFESSVEDLKSSNAVKSGFAKALFRWKKSRKRRRDNLKCGPGFAAMAEGGGGGRRRVLWGISVCLCAGRADGRTET